MKRNVARLIYFFSFIVGIILMAIFAAAQMKGLSFLFLIATLAGMLVGSHFLRCPHCGRRPTRGTIFSKFCHGCGEHMGD